MVIDSEGTAKFLEEFKPLIHKTLQRVNIPPSHVDHDDFFQELQIKLLSILEKFQSNTTDLETKKYKFIAYAGQGLYWHSINLIRRQSLQFTAMPDEESMDWLAQKKTVETDSFESTIHTKEFFELAKQRLSKADYVFLIDLIERECTMQELADAYGVSRTTIYNRRKKLQIRLQDLKECLKN